MSMDEDSTERWLLGGILTALLGGGVIVAVLFSIVLTPLAPYFAFGSGGGGSVCSATATDIGQVSTRSSTQHRSAVSPARSMATHVSTASLSLRDLCNANGGRLLRRGIWSTC